MKYDPHYYIQKIGDSIDSLPYVEVTVDNTKIIVVNIRAGRELIYKVYFTNFSKEISGWYHDMSTDEIVIFLGLMKDISEDVKEMIQVELGYSPNEQLRHSQLTNLSQQILVRD